jgi:hypothetical protein
MADAQMLTTDFRIVVQPRLEKAGVLKRCIDPVAY